jgi:hypothetical protein
LAFLSANLGAQEVIGMAASGAKYGIATSHFYVWTLVLLAFGVLMHVLGRRGTSRVRPAESTPERRAIEQIEHRRSVEADVPGHP